jgi:hypothetical protein
MQAEEEAFLPVILMENVGGVIKEVVRSQPRQLL